MIESGSPNAKYNKLSINTVRKYLPSLWKVSVSPQTQSLENECYLLEFNQGYDKNWKLYRNIWGAALGLNEFKAEHVKVNGLINGWEISNGELKTSSDIVIYVFYTPERLSVIGWVVTISTLAIPAVLATRRAYTRKSN